MRYSIQDYNDIVFAGYDYKLPESTSEIIKTIVLELGVSTLDTTLKEVAVSEHRQKKQGYFSKKQRNISKNDNLNEIWETQKAFKPTVMEKKEGIDKTINDIRICLNKISNKNYETQRDIVIEYIENIIKNQNGSDVTDINNIANSIFEIASTNKFYSELYATLYKELIHKFNIFNENINQILQQYKDDIINIRFVDPNTDYDLFCDNNKQNDKRKALTTFIVNLMKKNVIDISEIANIVLYLEDFVLKNIDIENKNYEIEEITENLFLFISLAVNELKLFVEWENIINNIKRFSQLKTKEHLSISSRSIFKFMDILDKIKV
uniref:MIF4G domain-containing protein n=1 Tax=viral metagenome TaxID=1070528 RepID=A0A6C0JNR3_9ZZZZ